MASVGRMTANLVMNVNGFLQPLNRAQRGLNRFQRSTQTVQRHLSQVSRIGARTGVAFTALTAGITAAARGAAVYANEIDKVSLKLGIGIESLQSLNYAMDQVGVSQSSVERALGRLNQRIGMAAQGSAKYGDALRALNIDMEKVQTGVLGTEEVFGQVIDSLGEMESSQKQSALAAEIFGTRMARDLMPAIAAGGDEIDRLRRDAQDLGLVMSETAVKDLTAFHDELNSTRDRLSMTSKTMAAEFLPALRIVNEWINRGISYFQAMDDEQKQQIVQWTAMAGAALGAVAVLGVFAKAAGLVLTVLGMMAGILKVVTAPWVLIGGLIATAGAAIYTAWNEDWKGIRTDVTDFFQSALESLQNFYDWFLDTPVGESVQDLWNRLVEIWEGEEASFLEKLAESGYAVWDFVVDIKDIFVEWAGKRFPGLVEWWEGINEIWQDDDLRLHEKIIKSVSLTVNHVTGLIESIMEWWIGTTLRLVERGAELLGLNPDKLWIVGFLRDLNVIWENEDLTFEEKVVESLRLIPGANALVEFFGDLQEIWTDEDLTFPQRVVETVSLVVGRITGLIESIMEWWTGVAIDLVERGAKILGLDPDDLWISDFFQSLNSIWKSEDLYFTEKVVETIRLLPGGEWIIDLFSEIQDIWQREDLSLPQKAIETIKVIGSAVIDLATIGIEWLGQRFDTFQDVIDVWRDEDKGIGEKISETMKIFANALLEISIIGHAWEWLGEKFEFLTDIGEFLERLTILDVIAGAMITFTIKQTLAQVAAAIVAGGVKAGIFGKATGGAIAAGALAAAKFLGTISVAITMAGVISYVLMSEDQRQVFRERIEKIWENEEPVIISGLRIALEAVDIIFEPARDVIDQIMAPLEDLMEDIRLRLGIDLSGDRGIWLEQFGTPPDRVLPDDFSLLPEDIKSIAKMVHLEAADQGVEGQAAVAAVILNRLISKEFPGTVEGVLSQPGQFQPYGEGDFYALDESTTDLTEAIKATKKAISGWDPTDGALYFYNPTISSPSGAQWFEDNVEITIIIGDHHFGIGKAHHMSEGGLLPGYGGGDRIPALLEAGEAVVPAKVVSGGLSDIVAWFRSMGVAGYKEGRVPAASIPGLDPGLAGAIQDQESFLGDMQKTLQQLPQAIVGGIMTAVEYIGEFLLVVAENLLGEERVQALQDAFEFLQQEAAKLRDAFGGVDDQSLEMIRHLRDVEDGLEYLADTKPDTFMERLNKAAQFAKDAFFGVAYDEEGEEVLTTSLQTLQEATSGAASDMFRLMNPVGMLGEIFSRVIPVSEMVQGALDYLAPLIEELAHPFQVMGEVVGMMLAPVLKALAPIITFVGDVFIGVAKIVSKIWNALIGFVTTIMEALGSIEVFGNTLFPSAKSAAESLEGLMIDTDELSRSQKDLRKGYEETEETVNRMNEAMRNVPRGFQIALEAWRVGADPDYTGTEWPEPIRPPDDDFWPDPPVIEPPDDGFWPDPPVIEPPDDGFWPDPPVIEPPDDGFWPDPPGIEPPDNGFWPDPPGIRPPNDDFWPDPPGVRPPDNGFWPDPPRVEPPGDDFWPKDPIISPPDDDFWPDLPGVRPPDDDFWPRPPSVDPPGDDFWPGLPSIDPPGDGFWPEPPSPPSPGDDYWPDPPSPPSPGDDYWPDPPDDFRSGGSVTQEIHIEIKGSVYGLDDLKDEIKKVVADAGTREALASVGVKK